MSAAEKLVMPLTEIMPWPEIQARFPHQYVLLVDMREFDTIKPMSAAWGCVMSHGRTREEAITGIESWRDDYDEIGFFYTGIGMPDEDRIAI